MLVGTFLSLGSPMVADVCSRAGVDWVVVDLEHGGSGDSHLLAMLHAVAGSGVAAIVRVESAERIRVGRALDLGADGIVVPRLESTDEAREVASWLRYPPVGIRGVALFTRGLGYGAGGHGSVAPRNDEIAGIVQVENRAVVEAAVDIAAIDGIDCLFVGPADLSHALGVPGDIRDETYRSAIERVGRAARDHGKAAGVLIWRPEDVELYTPFGFTFFSVSADGPILQQAMRAAVADTRGRLSKG
jgi:2-dehydro-3-deoxyglucarate aldolase/4-hydroxy-2-oxoheptanedioate aldolase